MRGQTLHSQAREIVRKVIKFCEEEKRNEGLLIPLVQATKRAAAICGVSEQTIGRVRNETKKLKSANDVLSSPGKHRLRPYYRNIHFEEFSKCAIRNIIIEFYIVKKSVPSIGKLLPILQEQIHFTWGRESLRKILHDMGYRWRKCGKTRVMMEQPQIVTQRYEYLRDIQKFRDAGRSIVYIHETWIDTSVTFQKCWQRNDKSVVKKLFVVHACGASSFIPNALFLREVKGVITYEIFEKWLRLKLVPNLPPNSVLCLESAQHHTKKMSEIPNKCSTKSVMTEWLRNRKVPFDSSMRKPELYQLVTENAPTYLFRSVDQLLRNFGHDVLQLPDHHCDLNMVPWAWQDLKSYIKERVDFDDVNLQTLKQLAEDGIQVIENGDFSKYSDQVMRVEESYWEKDAAVENVLDQIVLKIGSSIEESDSESSESDAEDSETEVTDESENLRTQPEIVLGSKPSFAMWLKTNSLTTTATSLDTIVKGPTTFITPDADPPDLSTPGPSSRMEMDSSVVEPAVTAKEEPTDPETHRQDSLSVTATNNQDRSLLQISVLIKKEPERF